MTFDVKMGKHPDDHGKVNVVGASGAQREKIRLYFVDVNLMVKRDGSPAKIYVRHQVITMPALGESILVDVNLAIEIFKKTPPGMLLTEAQGGAVIADNIREQIADGIALEDINVKQVVAKAAVVDLSDDDLLEILKSRGLKVEDGAVVAEPPPSSKKPTVATKSDKPSDKSADAVKPIKAGKSEDADDTPKKVKE